MNTEAPALDIQMIDVDGQTLRVGVQRGGGNAPPLLVFNGVGANLELMAPFAAALLGLEVIVFDIPGVGGSPLPRWPYRFWQVAGLAERLLLQLGHAGPVDVLGVSWGGALAQHFAYRFPQRCRRLILAATSAGAFMVPGRLRVLLNLVSPRRYRDPAFLTAVGGELYGGRYRSNRDLLSEHSRHMRPPKGLGYLYQLLAGWGWTSVWWLGSLRQPTLVMHGTDDPIVPLVNAKILVRLIRRARLFVIDDGHLFLVSRAREIAPVVRGFLEEPEPQAP